MSTGALGRSNGVFLYLQILLPQRKTTEIFLNTGHSATVTLDNENQQQKGMRESMECQKRRAKIPSSKQPTLQRL